MKTSTLSRSKIILLLSVVFLIAVWWVVSAIIGKELILPSPALTISTFLKIIKSDSFLPSVFSSILRGLLGFIISFILGLITGITSGLNKTVERLIEPYVSIIKATPVISFILLALIWISTNAVAVFIGILIAYPVIYSNVYHGIKSVDASIVEMAKRFGINRFRIIREIYIPSIIPYIFAGLSTALGIGWKAVVAAEALSQPRFGIGTGMFESKYALDISGVFAWTLVAVLLSFIFERLLKIAEKRIVKWR